VGVCVNKMDLVGYDEDVFYNILEEMTDWAARCDSRHHLHPISALKGDNVVQRSNAMQWYGASTLLYHLEHVVIAPTATSTTSASRSSG